MGAEGIQAKGPVCVQPGHLGNCNQMRGDRWGWRSIRDGCLRLRVCSRIRGFSLKNQIE